MDIKEIALKVADSMSNTTIIMPTNEDLIAFAEAAIQQYKDSLLNEVGEPVGCHYLLNNEMFPVEEVSRSNLKNNPQDYVFLYTSDQLAAAVLKATKPLDDQLTAAQEEITEMRADHLKLTEENHTLRDQLATAEQRVAEAIGRLCEEQEATYSKDIRTGDLYKATACEFIAKRVRSGQWRKFVKEGGVR